jgi:stress-induced morphogen
MSHHPTNFTGDVLAALRESVESAIPGARCVAAGGGGHYTLEVIAPSFAGLSMLASHRLVLGAIAHLMKGDQAPVHAVDSISARAE